MRTSGFLDTVGTVCKRYGPGRLPLAERSDVGAGYAGAAGALAVVLLYAALMRTLAALGSPFGLGGATIAWVSLFALPLVVPVAFLSGVAIWRFLPDDLPYFGVIAGLVATLATYLGAVVVLAAIGAAVGLATGASAPLGEGASLAAVVGSVAFLLTFWLTLPVGAVSGATYERVGATAR